MKVLEIGEVAYEPLMRGAELRNDFPGYQEDYLAIHCLIVKHQPRRFMEIGTSAGRGTRVICRAMGIRRFRRNSSVVYSLDVPPGTDPNVIYPEHEDGHPKVAGRACRLPYEQLYGNSMEFDFAPYYPIDGWFIDGKHNFTFAKNDTKKALLSHPQLIIWHDMQIEGVREAVEESLGDRSDYALFRVNDTRIAFAARIEPEPH